MKRYAYHLNDSNLTLANFGEFTPLKYIETVPGDTIAGTMSVQVESDVANRCLKNRAYFDIYAFYIPFRLLWEDFPAFIAKSNEVSPVSVPLVTTLFPENFETTFLASATENTAFLRRAYNAVAYQFFARHFTAGGERSHDGMQKVRDGDFDSSTTLGKVWQRPSTFDESLMVAAGIDDTTIDVSGSTITTQDIREAFAQDRFNKVRDFYGSKYTDYLAAVGVKASWSILDEPECIGVSNNDLVFRELRSTALDAENEFGRKGGQYSASYKLNIRRTFCPEHGVILIGAAPRIDIFMLNQGAHVLNGKTSVEDYFAPEFAYRAQTVWDAKVLYDTNSDDLSTHAFQEYRVGRNQLNVNQATSPGSLFALTRTATSWVDTVSSDGVFANVKQDVIRDDMQCFTESRVKRISPVPPASRPRGVA